MKTTTQKFKMRRGYFKKILSYIDMRSAILFATVGSIAALINFTAFAILWHTLQINYKLAVTIAYVLSVIFHFTANRRFTFQSHGRDFHHHLAKYSVMIGINYLLTMLVVHIAVENLALSPYLGVVAAIGATVGVGYVMAKYWVFV